MSNSSRLSWPKRKGRKRAMTDLLALYDLAEDHGIDVYWFDLGAAESLSLSMSDGSCAIAMDPWRMPTLADEIGRFQLCMGPKQIVAFPGDPLAVCDCGKNGALDVHAFTPPSAGALLLRPGRLPVVEGVDGAVEKIGQFR